MNDTFVFDYSGAAPLIKPGAEDLEPEISRIHHALHNGRGPGSDFTGWLDWPETYDRDEFARIKETAKRIRDNCDAFVVVGIGGSYLGARAVIEMLKPSFYNQLPAEVRQGPEIYFVGHQLSGEYLTGLLAILKGKDVCINVVSKSGTTTESAIAFRFMRRYLEDRYGEKEAAKRIVVTTDEKKGALKQLADEKKYECFVIPDDIGGRYSVLTPVGLFPVAVAGIDIDQLMAGAAEARQAYMDERLQENPCYQYAAVRYLLYRKGKKIELLVNTLPQMHYFAEWWKQLFGESEGKNNRGIFPASVSYTTDLHSLGQYIQEGERHLFETVIQVEQPGTDLTIFKDNQNLDGLNYLVGRTMNEVNQKAVEGTLIAHAGGGVPHLGVRLPALTPYHVGWMLYFFKKACAVSGYLSGANPFDQPGVEAYKKNMFALLGKPGYEAEKEKLKNQIVK
ncbi:MAG: glucose-6-phosphate isomerase [Bacillaceae bacterium]|nr:glucose-6-phosphate isomerase [Bacillaceae bacterium]